MKKHHSFLIFCAALLLPFAGSAQYTAIQFSALLPLQGVWKMQTAHGTQYEIWEKKGDTQLLGKSYSVNGADSVLEESISLSLNNGQIWYTPVVVKQNNGMPVPFKLVSMKDDKFIFENKEHDFPQQISYRIVNKTELIAEISGNTARGFRAVPFRFVKQ